MPMLQRGAEILTEFDTLSIGCMNVKDRQMTDKIAIETPDKLQATGTGIFHAAKTRPQSAI